MKNFLALPNLIDLRNSLPRKGTYIKRNKALTTRVWHNSLTLSSLLGSDALGFAKHHTQTNGWPGIAYHLVIEPKNKIQTPHGLRARIVWANDFDRRAYHAGNANDYSIGICVAGDYRNEPLLGYVKATIDDLQAALVADGIGREDKSHHEMPGYSWKACCVFDYKAAFKFLDHKTPVTPVPGFYTIQEGDTFWNIANNLDGIEVADLMAANPKIDYKNLKIGQIIKLGKAKEAAKEEAVKQVSSPVPAAGLKEGQVVTLSNSATRYATGEAIPASVKGKKYTVMQIKSDRVLLKEILSWVKRSDISGSAPAAKPTKEYVQLPKSAATWRTYRLNVQPVAENSDWSLTPARFGGLEYEVIGRPLPNVVTVDTSKGKRNIYAAPSTGAKLIKK